MEILLYIILFIVALILLAVLTPLKLFLSASGGSDIGFCYDFRIMIFNGFFGGGIQSGEHIYLLRVFLGSRCILMVNVTRKISMLSRKVRARMEKRKEEKKKKPPAKKRKPLKVYYRLCRDLLSVLKWVIRELGGVIRFDSVSAHIKLGLLYPDITGWIVGLLYMVNGILPQKYSITPSFDFTRRVIDGGIAVQVTVRGYIFWAKLFTKIPYAVFTERERIILWYRVMKRKNSLQEV
jgi:hypothetical protein